MYPLFSPIEILDERLLPSALVLVGVLLCLLLLLDMGWWRGGSAALPFVWEGSMTLLVAMAQADSEEGGANGAAWESSSQQSDQTHAEPGRKSMESQLGKLGAEQEAQSRAAARSSSGIGMDRLPQRPSLLGTVLQQACTPHLHDFLLVLIAPANGRQHNGWWIRSESHLEVQRTREGKVELMVGRSDVCGVQSMSVAELEGGLVTPAQQREPQRPSTHKSRPPPLDTSQQGLAAAPPRAAGPLGGLMSQLGSSTPQNPAAASQVRCTPLAPTAHSVDSVRHALSLPVRTAPSLSWG